MEDVEILELDNQQDEADVEEIVDNLTLFDDDLMSRVFDKNIEATELFLGIVLERKIKVICVDGQDEMKNPEVGGRNITLDVHAIDENKQEIDIEENEKATSLVNQINELIDKKSRVAMDQDEFKKEKERLSDLYNSHKIEIGKIEKEIEARKARQVVLDSFIANIENAHKIKDFDEGLFCALVEHVHFLYL